MLNQIDQINLENNQGIITDLTPVTITPSDVQPPTFEKASQGRTYADVLQTTLSSGPAIAAAVLPKPVTTTRFTHAVLKRP